MILRRFGGLAVLFLGLVGAFSALTLVALGRGLAAFAALAAGLLGTLGGVWILWRVTPPDRGES